MCIHVQPHVHVHVHVWVTLGLRLYSDFGGKMVVCSRSLSYLICLLNGTVGARSGPFRVVLHSVQERNVAELGIYSEDKHSTLQDALD